MEVRKEGREERKGSFWALVVLAKSGWIYTALSGFPMAPKVKCVTGHEPGDN